MVDVSAGTDEGEWRTSSLAETVAINPCFMPVVADVQMSEAWQCLEYGALTDHDGDQHFENVDFARGPVRNEPIPELLKCDLRCLEQGRIGTFSDE